MLEQCCNYSKQSCNNIETLWWAKNSRCESSVACVASISIWFGSKERPRSRNRILGFGRARNETSAKKFFSRSLTLVVRSLLLNCTETLATQAKSSRGTSPLLHGARKRALKQPRGVTAAGKPSLRKCIRAVLNVIAFVPPSSFCQMLTNFLDLNFS